MVGRGELKPKDVKNDTVIFTGSDGLRYEKPADGEGEAKCIGGRNPVRDSRGVELGAAVDLLLTTRKTTSIRRKIQLH